MRNGASAGTTLAFKLSIQNRLIGIRIIIDSSDVCWCFPDLYLYWFCLGQNFKLMYLQYALTWSKQITVVWAPVSIHSLHHTLLLALVNNMFFLFSKTLCTILSLGIVWDRFCDIRKTLPKNLHHYLIHQRFQGIQ